MRRAPFSAATALLIVASSLLVAGPAEAANPSSDFDYTISAGNVTITDYLGTGSDVDIPATFSYAGTVYPVTAIGDNAFRGNGIQGDGNGVYLTSLVIPNSVVTIGANAFRGGVLTSIVIPDSVVTIGTFAFYNNSLTKVSFGSSLTTIGNNSFRGNYLTTVTIPRSVTTIGNNTFAENNDDVNTLTSAIFEGNAPALTAANAPGVVTGTFSDAGPILYYYAGATGFTTMYRGYATREISAAESDLSISPTAAVDADGTQTITLTATVRDNTEAVVAGVPVVFTVPTGVTASAASCTTAVAGTCAITLTSTTVGTFAITAKIGSDTAQLTQSVTFVEPPVAPVFTAETPAATATVGEGYSYTFAATGNPEPTFAVDSGALPAGLALSPEGELSGTPTGAGASTFTVAASNTVSPDDTTSALTITVAPAPAAPVFTAAAPPATATVGDAYNYTFAATGTPDPTFAVASGALPAGLVLSPEGVLSGTLTAVGASTFTVTASNLVAPVATTGALTITVTPVPAAPVFTAAAPLATATVGKPYSYTFAATGSPTPTFAVTAGTLPAGLTLTSAGVLSGTPIATGETTFTVTASNAVAPDATSTVLTITVAAAPNRLAITGADVGSAGWLAALGLLIGAALLVSGRSRRRTQS